MKLRTFARVFVMVLVAIGGTLWINAGIMWMQQAGRDGWQMMELVNAGGALFLLAFALYLFVVVEHESGDTLAETMFGSRE